MENCIDYGEKGDRFFIIISGIVSVVIPNPLIKNRALQRRDYE
jgi:CRP-like cAMP-binding protein